MSSPLAAAPRSCRFLLASSVLVPVLTFGVPFAKAQQAAPDQLPPIDVNSPVDQTRTRAKPVTDEGSGSSRPMPNPPATSSPNVSPASNVSPNRQFSGIVGSSSTVITAEDIAHSPAQTIQEIIAQTPGVQLTTLYGGVNGAGTTVDLRGFGAFASSNTLVLVNGRRLNDLDLQGVDLSTIPRDSIERIEIPRGNSGAVLYGDNAVGGVINIVTQSAVAQMPSGRIEGAFGSFRRAESNGSASGSSGPWSASAYGNALVSDGYRDNSVTRQYNGVADVRSTAAEGAAYFNVTANDQHLGLPGARRVDATIGVNQLITDRRGATTPFDFADTQGTS